MNRFKLVAAAILVALAVPAVSFAAYTYYFSDDDLSSWTGANWTSNGSISVTSSSGVYGLNSSSSGALISTISVPDTSNEYEVKVKVRCMMSCTPSGSTELFLRASTDAEVGTGTAYYATFSTGGVSIYKQVSGSGTLLGSQSGSYMHDGVELRAVMRDDGVIGVYADDVLLKTVTDTNIASGQPGVGMQSASSTTLITEVYLGPLDRTDPSSINTSSIGTSSFGDRVDIQWSGLADDSDGTGIAFTEIERDSSPIGYGTNTFSDTTVSASTSYTYTITAYDYHLNSTSANVSVTTPPSGSIDPRRVGIRSTGAYWGAKGEQIDLLSGNLNYTLPLITARSRVGFAVGFNLTYNSQNWREDGGGIWNRGEDVGYGYGWKLLAGSLTPYWEDYFTPDHYLLVDSTGAEYRLDQESSGVWTSNEGIFISYDSNTERLYLPDGSFWVMGSTSAGDELDAGTMYPTLMQDPNGNQIRVEYDAGANTGGIENTSARIIEIEDARAVNDSGTTRTYLFTYDGSDHLTGIDNRVATLSSVTTENYTFTYSSSQTLYNPFDGTTFGTTKMLQSVTINGVSLTYTFTTDTTGSLTKVTFPYGGYIRWAHDNYAYTGSREQPEVENRYLSATGTGEITYPISRDGGDSSRTVHLYALITDPGGVGQKKWTFDTNTSNSTIGLLLSRLDQEVSGPTTLVETEYDWSTSGPQVLDSATTTLNPGASEISKKTSWAYDSHGNLTDFTIHEFDETTDYVRDFDYTYVTDSNYTSRFIFNLLKTSKVQGYIGGAYQSQVTLATNYYDNETLPGTCSGYGSLTNVTGAGQHDDTNYSTSFYYRGNVTAVAALSGTTCAKYDILGNSPQQLDLVGRTHSVIFGNNYVAATDASVGSYDVTADFNGLLDITEQETISGTTEFDYDTYERPSQTTSRFGAVTTYAYTTSPPTVKATINGRWTKTTLDGLGRPILIETGDASSTESEAEIEYAPCACSPIGKVYRKSSPHDPTDPALWTTYTYDGIGRTVEIELADGASTTTYEYLANTVKNTDPAGKWKEFTMDELGQLVKVTEPQPTSGTWDTDYEYTLLGQLAETSQTRGATTQTRSYTYNAQGRVATMTSPERGAVTYTYNANGTLSHYVDAKNQKVGFTYDAQGRITARDSYPVSTGSADACQNVTYTWDSASSGTYAFPFNNMMGRLAIIEYWAADYGGCYGKISELYSYTSEGQLEKKALQWGTDLDDADERLQAEITYDNEGRQSSFKYPDTLSGTGDLYHFTYDSMGRLAEEEWEWGGDLYWIADAAYGPAGELLEFNYEDREETREYNDLYQLTRITNDGPGSDDVDFQYYYSATQNNGKITKMKDWETGEEVNYTYDALNRLATAATTDSTWGQSYSYDGFNNLLQQSVTKGTAPSLSVSVDATTNRLTGVSYDSNGNDTSIGNYDVLNRLVDVPSTIGYGYAPDNKRVFTDNGYEFLTLWVGSMNLGRYEHYMGGWAIDSENYYFGNRLIWTQGDSIATDRLNSNVAGGKRYFPWGQEYSGTADDIQKFTGYIRDSETGLDYAVNRYHDPGMGRFTTPDPAGDGMNWYAYAGGDPVNNVDPLGLNYMTSYSTYGGLNSNRTCIVGFMTCGSSTSSEPQAREDPEPPTIRVTVTGEAPKDTPNSGVVPTGVPNVGGGGDWAMCLAEQSLRYTPACIAELGDNRSDQEKCADGITESCPKPDPIPPNPFTFTAMGTQFEILCGDSFRQDLAKTMLRTIVTGVILGAALGAYGGGVLSLEAGGVGAFPGAIMGGGWGAAKGAIDGLVIGTAYGLGCQVSGAYN